MGLRKTPGTIICDLDGVLYLESIAVPGAGKALAALTAAGIEIVFATNNSLRTPLQVANRLSQITGFAAREDQVVTSGQAAAARLVFTRPRSLVVGGEGVAAPLQAAGIEVVTDWRAAEAVVVGIDPELSYAAIRDASLALRAGAVFIATNDDATYPTPDGESPGAGAIVAAIATASGVEPQVCGKPHPPMRTLLRQRAQLAPVWMVGDRAETDLATGVAEGWTTVLVLTGVTREATGVEPPPDFVIQSIAELPELAGLGTPK